MKPQDLQPNAKIAMIRFHDNGQCQVPLVSVYTIPFLEYSYDIKSAIIYVLPKQKNLTLKPVALDEEQLRTSEDQLD